MSEMAPVLDVVAVGSWTNFDHLLEVESLPAPGDTVEIRSPIAEVERVYFGGCAPNIAVAAACLGAKAALVSVVGEDFHTRGYTEYLKERGVEQSGIQTIAGERCGHSFLFRDGEGNSVCISQIGVAARQHEFQPDARLLAAARAAVITYRFDKFTLQAARMARANGATVILSGALATTPTLTGDFVAAADLLVCTEHELAQVIALLDCADEAALLARGLRAIICTRGRQGARLIAADERADFPALLAPAVIDPTGAGDGFVGGLAAAIASGESLPAAIRLGASVASFVVEAIGCQTNLPTLAQAKARLAGRG